MHEAVAGGPKALIGTVSTPSSSASAWDAEGAAGAELRVMGDPEVCAEHSLSANTPACLHYCGTQNRFGQASDRAKVEVSLEEGSQ